ncbi:RcnB family protein, partial [Rhodanobacter sp. L36]|uniref:RcnB family protein n=1 Tax=Rhodanobacter sp. L36 TaxID=1747221 RepID=UPI00131D240C
MKKQLSTLMICGALLLSASVAVQAQPPQDRDHHGHDNGHDQHGHGFYDRGRSEGWYKRGGHVPAEYRGGNYVVTDWRSAHLRQPPRGYHYVRSDNGDFLLVAITTGVIASILA